MPVRKKCYKNNKNNKFRFQTLLKSGLVNANLQNLKKAILTLLMMSRPEMLKPDELKSL